MEEFYPGDAVSVNGLIGYVIRWSPRARVLDMSTEPYEGGVSFYGINADNTHRHISLVSRGNVFRRQFGMELMPFADYAEEARFWRLLNMLEEVRNPADHLFYTWTPEQAMTALIDGTIDVFLKSTGGPGVPHNTTRYGAFRVSDPTGSERLRTKCLEALRRLQPA